MVRGDCVAAWSVVQDALDLELLAAHSGSLVSVYLRGEGFARAHTNLGYPLALAPAARAINPFKSGQLPNPPAYRDRLDLGDLTQDRDRHRLLPPGGDPQRTQTYTNPSVPGPAGHPTRLDPRDSSPQNASGCGLAPPPMRPRFGVLAAGRAPQSAPRGARFPKPLRRIPQTLIAGSNCGGCGRTETCQAREPLRRQVILTTS